MNPNLPIDHLLDEFLQGTISKEVLKNQTPQYQEEQLEKEIRLHQAASLFLERAPVIAQVNLLHEQFLKETRMEKKGSGVRLTSIMRWISVAAAIILLAGVFYWKSEQPSDAGSLYAVIYQPYQVPVYRSENKANAMVELYRKKQFGALILDYEKKTGLDNQDHLLAGLSYSALEQWNQAAQAFQVILDVNLNSIDPHFQDEAQFYGGLAYLKAGSLEKAIELFSIIRTDPQHLYHNQISADQLNELEDLLRK
ncbi:hypothetical protein [Flavihumibacter sp. UBA7668]|uniref:hypothetical protein n=1 Tax=Flavihumibacter sp. UBA7668 TaxID=1946542 RepID=UPI0025BCCF00|nr:hypothetical protein [Flavihumibacter sp. UBA7668]